MQIKNNIKNWYAEGIECNLNLNPEIGRITELGRTFKLILGSSIGFRGFIFKIGYILI